MELNKLLINGIEKWRKLHTVDNFNKLLEISIKQEQNLIRLKEKKFEELL